jgi:CheY-like chemotaxis protein
LPLAPPRPRRCPAPSKATRVPRPAPAFSAANGETLAGARTWLSKSRTPRPGRPLAGTRADRARCGPEPWYGRCFVFALMHSSRMVLLVDPDAACGRALAALLRRQGDRVRVVRTPSQALSAVDRDQYDLGIVDLFVDGGGVELARQLQQRVPRLLLSLGARLGPDELLEAAVGFSVHHKAELPGLLRAPAAASNGRASLATRPAAPRPFDDASGPAPRPVARGRRRARRLA